MSYDTPQRETISIASAAFGATTDTHTLQGPKGKKGLVRDITQTITADMVGTTTVPEIDVGTASGDVSYARYRLGSAAGTGYTAAGKPVARATQDGIKGLLPPTNSDFAGHVALETAYLPADTAFVVTRKAGVGGVPAGAGETQIVIDWF